VKRNTETRFYKRVMEREQERITLSESVRLGTKKSEDGLTDLPLSDEEKSLFSDRLVALDEKLLLMKDGIPEETAEMYLSAQKKWHDLSVNRDDMLTSLARADATLLEVRSGISTLTDQIMKAKEKVFSLALSDAFVWPVHGSITAGFFDREYQRVFGVPHRAIDIATHQSTPVHSIADGVVYATRDGGETGYSYVLIGHSDGYSSLYGHVSQFLVHAGDTVSAGQVIALSGGAPGTHGAGHMTTGAHLHLEVMKNGVHLDPRTVLPSVR
jgi:murein DD-endopeptidase MepM/ murein hydrolase activator NlpD